MYCPKCLENKRGLFYICVFFTHWNYVIFGKIFYFYRMLNNENVKMEVQHLSMHVHASVQRSWYLATVLTKPGEREENELVPWLLLSTHNFSLRYLYYFTLRMKATLPLQIRLTRNLQFHYYLIYYFDHFMLKKVPFVLLCFFVKGYLCLSIDLRSIKEATNVLPLSFSWREKRNPEHFSSIKCGWKNKRNIKTLSSMVGLYSFAAHFFTCPTKRSSSPKNGLPPIKW